MNKSKTAEFYNSKYITLLVFLLLQIVSSQNVISVGDGEVSIKYLNKDSFIVSIRARLDSWVGLGFGSSMTNTDMHVVEFYDQNNFNLMDLYSKGYEKPKDDVSLGGTYDLKNITYKYENGFVTVTYSRLYDTGDIYDAVILPDKSYNLIMAWNSGNLTYHGANKNFTVFTINSQPGRTPGTSPPTPAVFKKNAIWRKNDLGLILK
jgi:hypothetical protein